MHATDESLPVEAVIATADLMARPARAPDHAAEAAAMRDIAAVMTQQPEAIVQSLVDHALALTRAGSAGLSLIDNDGGKPVFRWKATAGELARYKNGTMPRDFSPCGEVCRRDEVILMRDMVRAYPYVGGLHAPVIEALLVPFHKDGAPVGTIWVLHHNHTDHFDAEDRRLVEGLTRFASLAAQASLLVADLRAENAAQKAELMQAASRDTVQQMQLDEAVEEAAALSEAYRKKDDFLAVLGHEMRNPLNPLHISAHLLRNKAGDDPETKRLLDVIDRQTRQLQNLADGLMDAAAVRTGKVELRRGAVSLRGLIAAAVEQAAARIEERKQHLALDLPEAAVVFSADEARLVQVFTNLLSNAAKYTPAGGNIRITGRADESVITVDVEDDGIGLAAGDRDAIFEMFSQVESASPMYRGGLGIGLALVKQIVELHGGSVQAFSAGRGQGSCFSVRLPRAT